MLTIDHSLSGVTSSTLHPNGAIHECTVNEPNVISTICGQLVPRYERPDARSKELKSVSFYDSGALRAISLNAQQEVDTPIGKFPAELVTFHPDGTVDAVFPLNGQLGFGWSESEEKSLAETYSFEFAFGTITAKIISLRFYETGEVKSLTLWPGEIVPLHTPVGEVRARTGITVYPSGKLASFEPAVPLDMPTPIGRVRAYDVNAVTVSADSNSVRFTEDGELTHIATSGDVIVRSAERGRVQISSRTRLALATDDPVKLSIDISFDGDDVDIDNGREHHRFTISECRFLALPDIDTSGLLACDTDCGSCDVACA